MRTFIAIDIPEEIKKEIEKIQDLLPEFSGKKTEKENLHLTLKFLGEIPESEIENIGKKLKEIKFRKFEAELSFLGVFDENFIRIVWIKLSGFEKLQKEIDEKLSDMFEKEKRFMSHLTLARVKNIKDKKNFLSELGKIKYDKKKFVVSEFKLKKSELTREKPVYSDIKKYRLES